jgi:hypothetical protein
MSFGKKITANSAKGVLLSEKTLVRTASVWMALLLGSRQLP